MDTVFRNLCRELEEDRMLSTLTLSPSDGTAAFLLRRADLSSNRYRTQVYRQRGTQPPELLDEGPWSGLLWTPQGQLVGTQRTSDGIRMVYFDQDGNKTQRHTLPCSGQLLAILDNGDCLIQSRIFSAQKNTDPHIVFTEEFPLFHNDTGLVANSRSALFHYCASEHQLHKLTEASFSVSMCSVDLARGLIAAVGKEYVQTPELPDEIRVYSLRGSPPKHFLNGDRWNLSHMTLWNGKIVFAGINGARGVLSAARLMQLDPDTGRIHSLSEEEVCLGNKIVCDFRFGAGPSLVPAQDGLYAITTEDERSQLCRFTLQTGWQTLCRDMDAVTMLDTAGGRVVFSALAGCQREELYEYRPDGTVLRISSFHPPLSGPVPHPISVTVNAKQIRGFVLEPEQMEAGKQYPAVLSIHGGPRMVFGRPTGHDHRMLSQLGVFVLWCNPSGSDGRGSAFYDLRGHWGSEMNELLAFVAQAQRLFPIDPNRIGVMGGSYGGYMVNCLVAQTDQFAAAVSERSISALPWQELLSDLPAAFRDKEFSGSVFSEADRLWALSPIHTIEKGTTPTLFIQGDADYRCPSAHGAAMYQALKQQGTPVRMVVFHRENHGLNRTGKPLNRLKRWQEICCWFEQWLMADVEI